MSEGRGLLPKWRWWPGVPFGALVIVALLGFWLPPESAHYPTNDGPKASAQPEKCEDRRYWGRTVCDPVAGFTGILALFSGLLTIVSFIQIRYLIRADVNARRALIDSRRSANRQFRQMQQSLATAAMQAAAADINAKIALNQALPQIRIHSIELSEWKDWTSGTLDSAASAGKESTPTFAIHNHGTTNATILRVGTNRGVGERVTKAIPEYREWTLAGGVRIIGANSGGRFEDQVIVLSPEQRGEVDAGKTFLWYWGRITVQDFREGETEVGFIFRYDPKRDQFVEAHNDAYTFRRQTKPGRS